MPFLPFSASLSFAVVPSGSGTVPSPNHTSIKGYSCCPNLTTVLRPIFPSHPHDLSPLIMLQTRSERNVPVVVSDSKGIVVCVRCSVLFSSASPYFPF